MIAAESVGNIAENKPANAAPAAAAPVEAEKETRKTYTHALVKVITINLHSFNVIHTYI